MGNLRAQKPPHAKSAWRRFDRKLGRIGVNGKPTPRARELLRATEAAHDTSRHACRRCGAEATVLCSKCRESFPCRCGYAGASLAADGFDLTYEHEDDCPLLRDPKPRAHPDEDEALEVPERRPRIRTVKRRRNGKTKTKRVPVTQQGVVYGDKSRPANWARTMNEREESRG